MAGYLKKFTFEQDDNNRRYRTNIEAIMKKYDRNFENDEVINLTSNTVVKQIGNPIKSRNRSFGYSHLETTRRREQSFRQSSSVNSLDHNFSIRLNSSGNVTVNTATSEDASTFDGQSLIDICHPDHQQVIADDFETTISSFLEPCQHEHELSDGETLSSFSGDSTGSDPSDNYLDFEHNDCVNREEDDGQYSTASSTASGIILEEPEMSPASKIDDSTDEFHSDIRHCSIMCFSGFTNSKVTDKQKNVKLNAANASLQPSRKHPSQVSFKPQMQSSYDKARLKSPKQIFSFPKLKPGEKTQKNGKCVDSYFVERNSTSERGVTSGVKICGARNTRSPRHVAMKKHDSCKSSPKKFTSIKSPSKTYNVDRKVKQFYSMSKPDKEEQDVLGSTKSSPHKSNYSESSDAINTTYILSPPGRSFPTLWDNSQEDKGIVLVLSSPREVPPVMQCEESPNKAAFVSHSLKNAKWHGRHTCPIKKQYKSAQQSKLQRQQPVSPNWKQYCHKKLGTEPRQIIQSPKSNKQVCSNYVACSNNVSPSRQSLSEDESHNCSINEVASNLHLVKDNRLQTNQTFTNKLTMTVDRRAPVVPDPKNEEKFKFMSDQEDELSAFTESSVSNKSGSCGNTMLYSPEYSTHSETVSETINNKVKSWLRTLNASAPFTDTHSSPYKNSTMTSPWLRKTETHIANFGASLKTPPILKNCGDGKNSPAGTVANGHVNLKGKSLMEIFTKLKKAKTEMKSKRLSPKKDRRRSLPFIRAKKKLKLVSSKMSQKSILSIDEDETNGVTCTKAVLHNSEAFQQSSMLQEQNQPLFQKVCVVSPRKRFSPVKLDECSSSKYLSVPDFNEYSQSLDMNKYLLTSPRGNEASVSLLNQSSHSTEMNLKNAESTNPQKDMVKISSIGRSPAMVMKGLQIKSPSKKKENRSMDGSFTPARSVKAFDLKHTQKSCIKSPSSPQCASFDRHLSCSPSVAMGKLQIRSPNSCTKSASKRNALLLSQCLDNEMLKSSEKTLATLSEHLFKKSEIYNNCHQTGYYRTPQYDTATCINGRSREKINLSPHFLCMSAPAIQIPSTGLHHQTQFSSRRQLEQQYSNQSVSVDQSVNVHGYMQKVKLVVASRDGVNSETFVTPSPSQKSSSSWHTDETIPLLTRDLHCTYNVTDLDPDKSNTVGLSSNTLQRYHNRLRIKVPPKNKMENDSAEMHTSVIPKQHLKSIKESLFQKYAIKNINSSGLVHRNNENRHIQSTPQKVNFQLRFDESLSTICNRESSDSEEEVMTISPVRN